MSKRKGKRPTRQVVSKERIAQASYAKKAGLLSKSAKTTGGKLSRAVQKKIGALEELRAIPTFIFEAGMKRAQILDKPDRALVKVKPKLRKQMKEQGYEVFNSFALVPKDAKGKPDERYVRAIEIGKPAGIKRTEASRNSYKDDESGGLNRVSVDTIEVITLHVFGINNYAELHWALVNGELDKNSKYDDEVYAFTAFGYHPRGSMTFFDGPELAAYLDRYKWTDEFFENFELVRMRMGDTLGPTPDDVYIRNRRKKRLSSQDRRRDALKLKARKLKENRTMQSEEVYKEKARIRAQQWRDKQTSDPKAAKEYRKKAAARAARNRAKRKQED